MVGVDLGSKLDRLYDQRAQDTTGHIGDRTDANLTAPLQHPESRSLGGAAPLPVLPLAVGAVRKNVAHRYGLKGLRDRWNEGDPWETLFEAAVDDRPDGLNDLVPFWVFEDGPAQIERRIPILPYSREVQRLQRLKHGLAVYRLAFGQPRQEDLVEFLAEAEVDEEVVEVEELVIRLGVG